MKDQEILLQELKEYGFNDEEIGKIFRGLKDEEGGKFCTIEEVCSELNLKIKTFPNEHSFYDFSKRRLKTDQRIYFNG